MSDLLVDNIYVAIRKEDVLASQSQFKHLYKMFVGTQESLTEQITDYYDTDSMSKFVFFKLDTTVSYKSRVMLEKEG